MSNRIKKILVTGGAGYLGSVMVPKLLEVGHKVTVIDNFMYGQTPLLDVCHYQTLKVVRGDVKDKKLMKKHLADVEFIFPLAALVGVPACDANPIGAQTTNLEAIELILKLRDKSQKIIFPNTNSGYGRGQGQTTYCDETTPLNPISLYGRLKVEVERMLLKDKNAISLRLATVFGTSPRMRLDLLVNDFVWRALNDKSLVLFEPHFKRNYLHIRDVARSFLHAMDNFEKMKNEPYNVGLNDANLSKLELCEEIKKQIASFHFVVSEIGKDPDQRNYIVSNVKIEKTGFKPRFSLQDGIAEIIKGYQIVKGKGFSNV